MFEQCIFSFLVILVLVTIFAVPGTSPSKLKSHANIAIFVLILGGIFGLLLGAFNGSKGSSLLILIGVAMFVAIIVAYKVADKKAENGDETLDKINIWQRICCALTIMISFFGVVGIFVAFKGAEQGYNDLRK